MESFSPPVLVSLLAIIFLPINSVNVNKTKQRLVILADRFFDNAETTAMMKTRALLLTLCAASAAAFSAVAPKAGAGAVAKGEIDRSMKGIDKKGSFDPVEGENAALKRNNNDEVWVPQVNISGLRIPLIFEFVSNHSGSSKFFTACSASATASQSKVACDAEHGPRKHRNAEQLYLPSFHPRGRL